MRERKYDKLPTNWHYNKICIVSFCCKNKLTNGMILYSNISNIFFYKSKFFCSPEFFSLYTCIYCISWLKGTYPTTKTKILHSDVTLFTSSLCLQTWQTSELGVKEKNHHNWLTDQLNGYLIVNMNLSCHEKS